MRGVRALTAPRCEQALRPCQRQQAIQEEGLCCSSDEPATKLTQDGRVEAGVGEGEAEDVLPINPATDGLRGLAIRSAFGTLEDRDHGEAGGRFGRLAAPGEEGRALRVVVKWAEMLGDLHREVTTRERGTGYPLSVFRDGIGGVRM
jgi:hypothetical protein